MKNYVEYDLENGATILVEAPDDESSGIIKAAREEGEITTTKAKKSFADALKDIKAQAKLLLAEVEDLHVNEAEVKFGINTVGELGNMAIGKIGVGVNYEVTLKWAKSKSSGRK
jgi:hypothetical protein